MKSFIQFINEKKADRIKNATGGKKTGSFSKGNLSFPGDRSGAYKSTKIDIEVKKGLKDAGASGDFSPTMPPEVRAKAQAKRDARIKKLATPDPFDPNYDKKTGNIDGRSKTGKVFKSTKPVTTSSPAFGKGDTPGQIRVKGLEKKTFKKTQPSDIKLPKSFTKFSRDLQDFKDRDFPGGPRKTTTTKPKTSSPSFTRQDVGMAPPDKPKVVKQSEISKQAKSSNVININKSTKPFSRKSVLDKISKMDSSQQQNLIKNNKGAADRINATISKTKDQTGSQMFDQNKIQGATGPKSRKDVKLPDFTSNRVDLRKVENSKNKIDFGSQTINPKDTPRARAKQPYSGGPTNYPKRGKVSKALGMSKEFRSSWKTRAKVKQFGAASGVLGGIDKFKQERAKGKGVVSSTIAGGLKGAARFAGTYGGAMLARKFGGKTAAMGLTGLVGGAIGDKGYDVTSKTVNRVKNLFSSGKKSNKPPKVPPKPPIKQYKFNQKPRYDIPK